MGVMWRHVPNGVYDRGKSATNRAEADAIVAEIVRRVHASDLSRSSLGVVTFSQAQQTLIEDLFEEVRRADPQVDALFAEEHAEPIFVKNLENVQGDERDVILFSICYGPDALGRVSMNFGPMNHEGGERRLNVAITRARREVVVFSTLRAEHIDLARTRARGVRDLKAFLTYAEHGPAALTALTSFDPEAACASPLEQAVYDTLVARGWEVHTHVGCARYRIDLAVVDPAASGRYLLGIECDGAHYHRTRVARDRDKLRESILRDLGWTLHRIWSADWWTHPAEEVRKLEAALQAARHTPRSP
jgi:very-short-patch-repair endonuclease